MKVWAYVFITTEQPRKVVQAIRQIPGVAKADALRVYRQAENRYAQLEGVARADPVWLLGAGVLDRANVEQGRAQTGQRTKDRAYQQSFVLPGHVSLLIV